MKKFIIFLTLFIVTTMVFAYNFTDCNIYVWDNDNNLKLRNPDNPEYFIGFEYNFVKAFRDLGISEEDKNLTIGDKFPLNPEETSAIFIVCGTRPSSDEMFTTTDMQRLKIYLENGGCLYIEGNNVVDFFQKSGNAWFTRDYFNIRLLSAGDGYAGYDTVRTDTNFTFFRNYSLVYPEGTAPDWGIDEFGPAESSEFYHSIMVYDDRKAKMYLSTAAAYTPPLPKQTAEPIWKAYMSSVDFGAYAAPHRKELQLADSTENQLIRDAHLSDILRLFSIGKVLLVNHTPNEGEERVHKAMDKLNIDYDKIWVKPGNKGPTYDYYLPYSAIVWYSTGCGIGQNITVEDMDNLAVYMDYGGSMLMSGEQICNEIGNPEQGSEHPFLAQYFKIDYVGTHKEGVHLPEQTGFYKAMDKYIVNYVDDPDIVLPSELHIAKANAAFNYDGTKAPAPSSVTSDALNHKSAFFAFAIEHPDDQRYLDEMLAITMTALFDIDTTFVPLSTSIKAINVSYNKTNTSVSFTISVTSNSDGEITLVRNGNNEKSVKTDYNQSYYKLTSAYNSGLYVIEYIENGSIVSTYNINISAAGSNEEKVYAMNNILYIESKYDNAEVSIYDITGKHIDKLSVQNGKTIWNKYTTIPAGIYFAKFINTTGNIHKILKY